MIAQVRGLTSCNLKYRPWRLVLNFDRAVIAHCLQVPFGHLLGLGIIDRFDKGTGARRRKPICLQAPEPCDPGRPAHNRCYSSQPRNAGRL